MLTGRIILLFLSIALQVTAAICAFRLIPLTKRRAAWLFISSAVFLMACRRAVTLLGIFVPAHGKLLRWTAAEGIALAISGLVLAGVLLIARVFREKLRVEEELEIANSHLERVNSVLRAIRDVNQLIVRERDLNKLVDEACHILAETRAYRLVWIGFTQEDSPRVVPVGHAGYEEGYLSKINATWDDSERGEDAIATAVTTRQPLVVRDIAHDPRFASCREEALKRGYVSSATLPLVVGERVCGTLSVYAGTSDVFDDDEVDLLKEMAGDVAFAIQSIEDEEARTRAEKEAWVSDRRFRALMEGAPVGILISSPDGGVMDVNAAALRMLGYDSKGDFLKVPTSHHYFEEEDRERFHELLGSGPVRDFEVRLRRKDGTVFWVSIASVAQAEEDGAVRFIKSFQDISERKRAEEQLKLFSQAVDGSADAMVMVDLDGKFTYVNRAYSDMFGYSREKLAGKNLSFCHPGQEQNLEEAMKATAEGSWTGELTSRRSDGQLLQIAVSSSRVVDGRGNPVALMASVRDMTELKRHESQLRQAQKMEAVGTLAGGIAHDFNNLLVPILGFAELALAGVPEGSKAREDVTQVLKAGGRAKDLAAQILAFSRQEEAERKPVQLAPIIKEALKLLVAALPSTIEIRQNIGPDTRAVNADPTQIHQILMNLCTNAERAMPGGGVLEVSLENVELDEERAVAIEGLRAGSYVRLTVSDTGCGMDEETLKRVFDPFFTTRGPGEGTGMGLSVVHGVVESHEGAITVDSELHRGTTFDVYLPAVESIAEDAPETRERVHGGSESILFVDDEAPIVEMGSETLTRLGYRVTTRTSSVEALELFRFKPGAFDLVITDQTMPNMSGADLARELLRIRPDIPIVLCTGFSRAVTLESARAFGMRELVMKPIVGAELGRTVRRVLDETSDEEG